MNSETWSEMYTVHTLPSQNTLTCDNNNS